MPNDSIGWTGILLRVVAALILVFLTWNAEGWSYYDWTIEPLLRGARDFSAIKFLAGALLAAGWVVSFRPHGVRSGSWVPRWWPRLSAA